MGKRLQRIGISDIRANMQHLIDTDVHLVLKDGATYYGIITAWKNDSFEFKDFRNSKHHFLLADVFEIVVDKLAAY
ncbi:hypothetical protein [Cytophaga hutchinsonii]|jgi:hypothetical protein|uniref:Uncharacterized protein n=1 Tax=Cytophaga hutchinsonii (strain ATCC 33406 / DSM 1761 / CIP 103989 / NBRC 15051 / NCIMB 9469 / D465) TaxID=269798 RepID=A0A6N4SV20_CYTH3|nr:hypothetical protein [Cytophaga hutchinsonii]ABG60254.1 conserved hypothetical protein [Cytophaga hutchinsonii ATCC 33406]SFX20704.1 hypothetical protein SAMN04487930_10244 [Cytophaga hutchinsonii ATCC 33406]